MVCPPKAQRRFVRQSWAQIELKAALWPPRVWLEHNPKNIILTVKHGGGNITLWACFSAKATRQPPCTEALTDENKNSLYWPTKGTFRMGPSWTRTSFLHPEHRRRVVDGSSSTTVTQNTPPSKQRSGKRSGTLRSWSVLAALQISVLQIICERSRSIEFPSSSQEV